MDAWKFANDGACKRAGDLNYGSSIFYLRVNSDNRKTSALIGLHLFTAHFNCFKIPFVSFMSYRQKAIDLSDLGFVLSFVHKIRICCSNGK